MAEDLLRGAEEAGDDRVQPFLLESSGIRGRLLRLGPLAQTILGRHDYPEPVARLLAELLALTGAMASLLKFEGVFTVQTKGNGPVKVLVADVTDEGDLRGYADFDGARLEALATETDEPDFEALVGEGYFAFTLDRGAQQDRYQGIVDLRGQSLADCLQHYFLQSDQVQSGIVLGAGRVDGLWRAGALILQRVPGEGGAPFPSGDPGDEEAWRRAMILQVTCTQGELLDPNLPNNDLLYRLFHEEGVRVYQPRPLSGGCRCSRARIERILAAMSPAELDELKIEGKLIVTCEFCSRSYSFTDDEVDRISVQP